MQFEITFICISGHISDDKQVHNQSTDQDVLTIVVSFVITFFVGSLIMMIVF